MKKAILFFAFILGAGLYSQAQVHPHAIGLRFGGDGSVSGAEISYQHGMGSANRIEFDLGFSGNSNNNHMFLAGIYQWDWNISGGFNWYIGPGAALGFHSYEFADDHLGIGIGGQIGLEYDFSKHKFPFLASVDARPMWEFIGDSSGFGWGISLGFRYAW